MVQQQKTAYGTEARIEQAKAQAAEDDELDNAHGFRRWLSCSASRSGNSDLPRHPILD